MNSPELAKLWTKMAAPACASAAEPSLVVPVSNHGHLWATIEQWKNVQVRIAELVPGSDVKVQDTVMRLVKTEFERAAHTAILPLQRNAYIAVPLTSLHAIALQRRVIPEGTLDHHRSMMQYGTFDAVLLRYRCMRMMHMIDYIYVRGRKQCSPLTVSANLSSNLEVSGEYTLCFAVFQPELQELDRAIHFALFTLYTKY